MITTIYTLEEISEILESKKIKKTSLYRALASGKLKGVKIGKRWIVSENALNIYLSGYSDKGEEIH